MTEPTNAAPEETEEGPRAFSVFLQALADGECHAQLSGDLQTLGKRLQEEAIAQQKPVKGSLALELNFAADEKGVVVVSYDVKRKDPKPKRANSIHWLTRGGNLSRTDTRQMTLGLRDVTPANQPVRDVAAGDDQQPRSL